MPDLGGQIGFWSSLSRIGEDVTLYRTLGVIETGGYATHVFADEGETVRAVIRPFSENVPHLEDEGTTGRSDEYRMYVDADVGLNLNDRIHYNGLHFRVTNPAYDQIEHVDRFRLREDEREFVQEAEVDFDNEDLSPPDENKMSGVE